MNMRMRRAFRRPQRKGDIREQAILDTAERLLEEKPFSEISVGELASGAGISRPSFYFYFESKEAVLKALIDRLAEAAYARRAQDPDLPFEVAIRRNLAGHLQAWKEHGSVLRTAFFARDSIPELEEHWEFWTASFVKGAIGRIQRERDAGRALPGPPSAEALAAALTAMNERCLLAFSTRGAEDIPEQEFVEVLTTVWMRAIYGTGRDPGT